MNRNSTFSPAISNILTQYKNAIVQLDTQTGTYGERLTLLQNAWNWGSSLVEKCSTDAVYNIVQRLLRHSWQLCFRDEWSKVDDTEKEKLKNFIEPCMTALSDDTLIDKFRYFLQVFKNPWVNEDLRKIFNGDTEITQEEEEEVHRPEIENVMVLRLMKLCEAKCEDLAFNYAKSCLRCLNATTKEHKETRQKVLDLYLALLLVLDDFNGCVEEMKKMPLSDGLEFIRRHKAKRNQTDGPEIMKFLAKVSEIATHLFLSLALLVSLETKHNLITFLNILSEWLAINRTSEDFSKLLRETFGLAKTSKHLYYCAKIIEKGLPDSFKTLATEFYIRGINLDINEIEMKKYDGDVRAEHILLLESNLSAHYVKLAENFAYNEYVNRECLLTAFSLRPVKPLFDQLAAVRIRKENEDEPTAAGDGENAEDVEPFVCTHVVIEATSPMSKILCKYCGKYRDPQDNTKADILLNSENLANVPAYLHNDLIVVIESPRIKHLSWNTPWHELTRHCQQLMDEDEKIRICSQYLISSNDQLQFLELDYGMFRHLPEGEYPGIEKGYEQFLVETEDETSDEDYNQPTDGGKTETGGGGGTEKKSKYYVDESTDEDDIPMAMLKSRKRKGRGRPSGSGGGGSSSKTDNRFGIKKFINRTKQNVPFKKRLVQKLKPGKPKFNFDYADRHAKFYIAVRKAQLDCKRQRIKLIYAKSNKTTRLYFYDMVNKVRDNPVRTELIEMVKNRPRYRPPPKSKPAKVQTPTVSLTELLANQSKLNTDIVQVLDQAQKANRRKQNKQTPKSTQPEELGATYSQHHLEAAEALTQMAHLTGGTGRPAIPTTNGGISDKSDTQLIDFATIAALTIRNSIKRSTVLAEQNGQDGQPAKKVRVDSTKSTDSESTPTKRGRGRPPGSGNKVKYLPDGTPVLKLQVPLPAVGDSSVVAAGVQCETGGSVATKVALPETPADTHVTKEYRVDSLPPPKGTGGTKVKPLDPQGPEETTEEFEARKKDYERKLIRNAMNREYRARKKVERMMVSGLMTEQAPAAQPLDAPQEVAVPVAPPSASKKPPPKVKCPKNVPHMRPLEPRQPDETDEQFAKREREYEKRRVRNEKERERRRLKKLREQGLLDTSAPSAATQAPPETISETQLKPDVAPPAEIPVLQPQLPVQETPINGAGQQSNGGLSDLATEETAQPVEPLQQVACEVMKREPPELEMQNCENVQEKEGESTETPRIESFNVEEPELVNGCSDTDDADEVPDVDFKPNLTNGTSHPSDDDQMEPIDFESLIRYENLKAVARKGGKKVIVTSTEPQNVPQPEPPTPSATPQSNLMKMLLQKSTPPPPPSIMMVPKNSTKKQRKTKTSSHLHTQTVNFVTDLVPVACERPSMIQQRRNYLPTRNSMIQARCNYLPEQQQRFFREVADFFKHEMSPGHRGHHNNHDDDDDVNMINASPQQHGVASIDIKNLRDDSWKKDPKRVLAYLIRTVPGMDSMEFFEPTTGTVTEVQIIHIKNNGVVDVAGTSTSTNTITATSMAGASSISASKVVVPASTSAEIDAPNAKSSTAGVIKQIIQIQKTTVPVKNGNASSVTESGNAIILNNLKMTPATTKRNVIHHQVLHQQRVTTPNSTVVTTAIASTSGQGTSVSAANSGHLLRILNSPTGVRNAAMKKDEKRQLETSSSPNNGVVQFICKTDGKVIHLTPITNTIFQAQGQTVIPTSVAVAASSNPGIAVAATTSASLPAVLMKNIIKTPADAAAAAAVAAADDDPNGINTRSVYEENYANFIRKNPAKSVVQTLPKFNHVFTSTGTTVVTLSNNKEKSGKEIVRPTVLQQTPRPRDLITTPLRIQVPLVPRLGGGTTVSATGVQRLVRPIIQLNSNLLKTEGGNVVIATTPRFQGVPPGGQVLLTTPKVDNSTLEQLREFDMVLEQVKERSATETPTAAEIPPKTEIIYANHPTGATNTTAPVLQKLMFIQQQKPNNLGTPLVVVTNYQNAPASPAPSVSSSTIGSPGSAKSAPGTPQKVVKSMKRETFPPKTSPLTPKLTQKPQEDEQTVQRIYDILAEYAEQLRNSPDLNNKPAPRRRSNPPTNPQTPGKKKKSGGKKVGSDANSDFEAFESDDTSSRPGSVSGVPSTSSHNFSPSDPDVSESDTSQPAEKPPVVRQLVLEDAPTAAATPPTPAKETKPTPNALLMPGNYLLPINLLKNGRQIAILTSANGSKILAALPHSPQKALELATGSAKDKGGLLCLRTVPNSALLLNPTSEALQQPTAVIISPKRRIKVEENHHHDEGHAPPPPPGPSYHHQVQTSKVVLSDQRMSDAAQIVELDKQLKLQKSLSEECEDLGVDEPEDLFPEADLLFESLTHDLPSSSKELDCLVDIGASTEIESSPRADLYEYTDEDATPISPPATATATAAPATANLDYRHKKLRLQPTPVFSYKRKRNPVTVVPKKTRVEGDETVTCGGSGPVTRRASPRGHVKKNCKCCKPGSAMAHGGVITTTATTTTAATASSSSNSNASSSNHHTGNTSFSSRKSTSSSSSSSNR